MSWIRWIGGMGDLDQVDRRDRRLGSGGSAGWATWIRWIGGIGDLDQVDRRDRRLGSARAAPIFMCAGALCAPPRVWHTLPHRPVTHHRTTGSHVIRIPVACGAQFTSETWPLTPQTELGVGGRTGIRQKTCFEGTARQNRCCDSIFDIYSLRIYKGPWRALQPSTGRRATSSPSLPFPGAHREITPSPPRGARPLR